MEEEGKRRGGDSEGSNNLSLSSFLFGIGLFVVAQGRHAGFVVTRRLVEARAVS